MNRREALLTLAAGSAAGALAGGMAIMTIPPAVAANADPLLTLIAEYRAQMSIFNASGDIPDEEDAILSEATYAPLWRKLRDDPPEPTTLQGAVEALRLAHEEMYHSHGSFERPLVGAALAFLEGRV